MLIKEHPGGRSCHKNMNCANIQYELYSVLFFKAIKSLLRCLRMIPFDRWVECDKNRDDVFFTGRRSYIPASFNNDKPYKSFLHFMNRILWSTVCNLTCFMDYGLIVGVCRIRFILWSCYMSLQFIHICQPCQAGHLVETAPTRWHYTDIIGIGCKSSS